MKCEKYADGNNGTTNLRKKKVLQPSIQNKQLKAPILAQPPPQWEKLGKRKRLFPLFFKRSSGGMFCFHVGKIVKNTPTNKTAEETIDL